MARMIGIVGGVGTFAGIDLYRKIYHHSGARTDQEHPPLALLSIPQKVADRTMFLQGEVEDNPGIAIAEIIHSLASIGAEVIGIPCNTAHAPVIFHEIEKRIPGNVQLLHLIEEVGRFLSTHHPAVRKAGILGTNGTYRARMYTDVLSSYRVEAVYPEEDMQEGLVHPAIVDQEYGIKAFSDPVTERARQDLLEAARYLIQQGSEAVILGCSEIPLAIHESSIGSCVVIDSVSVLAKALIRQSSSDNGN
jgi:aspartate racemase